MTSTDKQIQNHTIKLKKIIILAAISSLLLHAVLGFLLVNIKAKLPQPKPNKAKPIEVSLLEAQKPTPLPKPAVPKPAIPKPDVPKPAAPKPAAPKPAAPKPAAPKPAAPKPAAPKPAAPKPAAPKPAAPKPAVPKPAAPKPAAPKPAVPKPEAPKPAAPKPAASTTNVKLSARDASWRRQPRFNVKAGAAKSGEVITVKFRFTVDKKGNITEAKLIEGSKYTEINRRLSRQARAGKFNPFKNKDGLPVSGTLILPISIKVP